MSHYLLISVAGLTASGLIVLRHACRNAPVMPPTYDYDLPAPARRNPLTADCWRGRIGGNARTDFLPYPAATGRLMEKLRQEEQRQRPQEGRN
jgi:hypothetical protein